ncbi:MAG: aminoacyl-histidine dipeptidase [Deltaproteobacteria bacterium]|nr:aminoacyl-histidine dipeptidase [Deltaproteobacteria bacterium]
MKPEKSFMPFRMMGGVALVALMGFFCQAGAASVPDSSMKPFADNLKQLQPTAVFTDFYRITQVPRPSHHEEKISAFAAAFGRSLNLETQTDEVGNVIIRLPATKGYENRVGVVLQAHMDMVPQATPDKVHDFQKDPITVYVKDGYLTADRTTLGADDGIGMAIIMALLQDPNLEHGPIEALFTVNEEDGFSGVNGLKAGILKGRYLINIDSENEGTFTIGSAGGAFVDALGKYSPVAVPKGMQGYQLVVTGLEGGHSGVDIHKGGGSASKLMARLLWTADRFGLRLASLDSGGRYNAIPRDASALVAIPQPRSAAFEAYVQSFEKIAQSELAVTDPKLAVSVKPVPCPPQVMEKKAQDRMLSAVFGSINGVQRMSDSVPGLVETSSSIGIFQAGKGQWTVGIYVRSAIDSARDDTIQKLTAVMQLSGAEVRGHDLYSGWRPDVASPLLALMKEVYRQKFGKEAKIDAVHAGLETSVIGAKYPEMKMISVGPTLEKVHSPDERLEIASVGKVYDLLTETLGRVPAQ